MLTVVVLNVVMLSVVVTAGTGFEPANLGFDCSTGYL
jgi:hypothetical protein